MPYKLLVLTVTCALVASEPPVTRKYISVVGSGVTTDQGISSAKLTTAPTGGGMFVISDPGYYYLSDDLAPNDLTTANVPIIYINANNVVLDLATKSITAPTTNTTNASAAIQVADGKSNVTIKNGVINGIQGIAATGFGVLVNNAASTTVSHIVLENLAMYNCGYFGISIAKCNDLIIDNVQCTGNGPYTDAIKTGNPGAFSGGAYLNAINSATIANSVFSNNQWNIGSPTTANSIVGLYLNNCTSIAMNDSFVDNNTNATTDITTHTFGIFMTGTKFSVFTHVSASGNVRSGTVVSTTNTIGCYAFSLRSNSSSNTFINCRSCMNQVSTVNPNTNGHDQLMAFQLDTCNGNVLRDCIASFNSSSTVTTSRVQIFGFSLFGCYGNKLLNCTANENQANGSNPGSPPLRWAWGYWDETGIANEYCDCTANNNNVNSASGSGAYVAGFQIGDTSRPSLYTVVRRATVNNNAAYSSTALVTSARAYGILIGPATIGVAPATFSTGTIIEGCKVSSNLVYTTTSETTSAFTVASSGGYGIVDLTPASRGSTTLLRNNISSGHGAVFDGSTVNTLATNNMNYYLEYPNSAMQLLNNIKETNIANLNAIADINGFDLFNLSITNT